MHLIKASIALLTLTTAMASAAEPLVIPQFTDETAGSGVDSIYAGEWQYMVGGGAAAFDCNGDGYPDLALAGGERPASLYVNKSAGGGRLRFERLTSGVELDRVVGLYPLDIDGNGAMDLVLLRVGETALMRGIGGCRFERANELWSFDGGDAWWTAFAATWEHGASWPTLALGAYIDRKAEAEPWGTCTENRLYRPGASNRNFAPPVPLAPSYCALSMLFTDWNRSGTPSLRVSNDREYYEGGQEQLWHIEAGKPPVLYTTAEGWQPLKIWGMGITSTTLPGDTYPAYYLTSMADQKLQVLAEVEPGVQPRPQFKDIAYPMGVTAHRPHTGADLRPSTGWHAQFEDVNNDGLADLFVAKGNVDRMPDFAAKDPNNLLLQQPDGKFKEVGEVSGVASFSISRGAVITDFNLDGLLDLVVVRRREPATLWRNTTSGAGHWLGLRLSLTGPNPDAIGAWIEVEHDGRIQRREITSGGGHASGHAGWTHFGLGTSERAEIRVQWPDGEWSHPYRVFANQHVVIERGKPIAGYFYPSTMRQ